MILHFSDLSKHRSMVLNHLHASLTCPWRFRILLNTVDNIFNPITVSHAKSTTIPKFSKHHWIILYPSPASHYLTDDSTPYLSTSQQIWSHHDKFGHIMINLVADARFNPTTKKPWILYPIMRRGCE